MARPPGRAADHPPPEPAPGLRRPPFAGAEEALTGGWLRVAEPVAPDAPLLAFYADAWLPAPFPRLTAPAAAPTLDLTVHFRAPLPRSSRSTPARPSWRASRRRRRRAASSRRTARCGRRTGRCWPRAASSRCSSRRPGGGVSAARTGYLGLGSNVGDRREQLQAAVDLLPAHGVRVLASSSTYDTDPVGEVLDQPAFLNACVRIATDARPRGPARRVQGGRAGPGRETDPTHPGYVRHGPRPIDVDLLLLGDARAPLRAPHAPAPAGHARGASCSSRCSSSTSTWPPRTGPGWPTAWPCSASSEGVRRAGRPLRLPGPAAG